MLKNIAKDKILITGGTGFIGGYLVENLMSHQIEPIIISRKVPTKNNHLSHLNRNIVQMDLLDSSTVKKKLKELKPDIIIHLAGYARQPENSPEFLDKFNFEATVRLLDLANDLKIKKFIMTGTADEYGFQPCPQSETTPIKPLSDYAISKNKANRYAVSLFEKYQLPVTILRPFTIYGVGQPPSMFISQAVESAVRGIPFEMSKGVQKRDLLFVTDFVNAIIKTLTAENTAGETFNVGSGHSIALRDVAKKIWELAEADEKLLKIGARPTNEKELHDTHADISKIREKLNWEPEISVEEGLRNVVEKAKQDCNERQVSVGQES